MSRTTYFLQACPTCGRRLEIRVEHLGRAVECSHCRGRFIAQDSKQPSGEATQSSFAILDRVDQLLAAASDFRASHP